MKSKYSNENQTYNFLALLIIIYSFVKILSYCTLYGNYLQMSNYTQYNTSLYNDNKKKDSKLQGQRVSMAKKFLHSTVDAC